MKHLSVVRYGIPDETLNWEGILLLSVQQWGGHQHPKTSPARCWRMGFAHWGISWRTILLHLSFAGWPMAYPQCGWLQYPCDYWQARFRCGNGLSEWLQAHRCSSGAHPSQCNLHRPNPSVTQNQWGTSFQAAVVTILLNCDFITTISTNLKSKISVICCNLHQSKPSVTQNRWESSFQAAVMTNVFRTVTIPLEISQQTSFIVIWCNEFNAICTNVHLFKKPVTQNQWGAAFLSFCCYKTLQNCDNSITTISRNKSFDSMTFSRPKLQLNNVHSFVG